MKLYLHFLKKSQKDGKIETYVYHLDNNELITIEDFEKKVFLGLGKHPIFSSIDICTSLDSLPLKNKNMYISSFFNDLDDVIFYYQEEEVSNAPIMEEPKPQKEEIFESIHKYTFYEYDDDWVRVILDLRNVHKLPPNRISARFLDRSFEIKIRDLNFRNLSFGVPTLHCSINTQESKYFTKQDKLIICLKKNKKDDRWISLFKTKSIGGNDYDNS